MQKPLNGNLAHNFHLVLFRSLKQGETCFFGIIPSRDRRAPEVTRCMPLMGLLSLKKKYTEKSANGISAIRDTATELTAERCNRITLNKHLRDCRSNTPVPATPPRSAEVSSNTDAIELPPMTEPIRAVPRFERVMSSIDSRQSRGHWYLWPLEIPLGQTAEVLQLHHLSLLQNRHLRGFVYNASTLP